MGLEIPKLVDPIADDDLKPTQQTEEATEKHPTTKQNDGWDRDETVTKDIQPSVHCIEATTSVWTKSALVFAYVWIWIIYFVDSVQQGTEGALAPFVTSAFKSHSQTPAVFIMSRIIGGIFHLPLAKMLNIIGRSAGYMLCIILTTLGLVLMATCTSVQMYATAQVFFWVGIKGLGFCLSIFIADTSSLKNRGLMFAYSTSPHIFTAWLAGPISSAFLSGPGWRWAFRAFAIITPAITSPLWFLFYHYYRVAKSQGLHANHKHGRTLFQSFHHYCIEFDVIGLLLVSTGLSLFLLSINIYPMQNEGWQSPIVISFIVAGGLLLVAFAAWETWFAPVTFVPYELPMDRTIMGACVLATVVNGLDLTESTYIGSIWNVGSCFWGIPVGFAIRHTGRFKWLEFYFGVPLTMLGTALMIKFLGADANIGYVAMCQVFLAFGGGTTAITQQVAAMAAAEQQHVSIVLAIEHMFSSIGSAIGSTVASAIWQKTFWRALSNNLPLLEPVMIGEIYGNLSKQLEYPKGSQERMAIQDSYGEAQRYMLIGATCVLVLGLVAVGCWKDINVKDQKQAKDLVI